MALTSLGVFVAGFLTDVLWTRWTLAVVHRHALLSGCWAAAIIVAGGIGVHSIAKSYWYMVPGAAGAALGSYTTTRWTR